MKYVTPGYTRGTVTTMKSCNSIKDNLSANYHSKSNKNNKNSNVTWTTRESNKETKDSSTTRKNFYANSKTNKSANNLDAGPKIYHAPSSSGSNYHKTAYAKRNRSNNNSHSRYKK